ncbi:MAG: lipid A deacylase LpxR family protein [Chitinophagaceae bacterium]|nr:lipid A deacylase LpxR family protein [Chitinophagaceae bacterium]
MYTPKDITQTNVQYGDRSYISVTYFSTCYYHFILQL